MNRRDALKSLAAVAAGGSLPAAGVVVNNQAAIVAMLSEPKFDPRIFAIINKMMRDMEEHFYAKIVEREFAQ